MLKPNMENVYVNGIERCYLSDEEADIRQPKFNIYIPRLMPDIDSFKVDTYEEYKTGKLNESNHIYIPYKGVADTIEKITYIEAKNICPHHYWLHGWMPNIHLNGPNALSINTLTPGKSDTEDYGVARSTKPGGCGPHTHKIPLHIHTITAQPTLWLNVKYEDLNKVKIYKGHEMLCCFPSGDINKPEVFHIYKVIPLNDQTTWYDEQAMFQNITTAPEGGL